MYKWNVIKFAFVFFNTFVGSYWLSSIIDLMLVRANYNLADLLGISKAKKNPKKLNYDTWLSESLGSVLTHWLMGDVTVNSLYKFIIQKSILSIHIWIAPRWMPQNLTNEKSTLILAWSRKANIDPRLSRHITTWGHNKYITKFRFVHFQYDWCNPYEHTRRSLLKHTFSFTFFVVL